MASDCTVFGIGSDTAGSIRLPCHWSGVFGHKPSPGLVPLTHMVPHFDGPEWDRFTGLGPIGKNVTDLQTVMQVLSNNAPELSRQSNALANVKILYATELEPRPGMVSVNADIKASIEHICEQFAKRYSVSKWDTKSFKYLPEVTVARIICTCNFPNFLQTKPAFLSTDAATNSKAGPSVHIFWEGLRFMFGLSKFTFTMMFFEGARRFNGLLFHKKRKWIRVADEMEARMHQLLAKETVLILPTHAETAPVHFSTFLRAIDATYLMIANAFGLPSTHVPTGFDAAGLPYGLQVIAGPGQDWLTLAVAEEIERLIGQKVPALYSDKKPREGQ